MAQAPLAYGSVVWLLLSVVVCHGPHMLGSMLCITSYCFLLVTPRNVDDTDEDALPGLLPLREYGSITTLTSQSLAFMNDVLHAESQAEQYQ